MLVPEATRPSIGAIDETGRFTLTCYGSQDGAVRGRHPVQITAVQQLDSKHAQWLAPKKYADYHTSGLAVDISAPTDSLRIDLKWDGGSPFVEVRQSATP